MYPQCEGLRGSFSAEIPWLRREISQHQFFLSGNGIVRLYLIPFTAIRLLCAAFSWKDNSTVNAQQDTAITPHWVQLIDRGLYHLAKWSVEISVDSGGAIANWYPRSLETKPISKRGDNRRGYQFRSTYLFLFVGSFPHLRDFIHVLHGL